jgi:hypothetical protein
VQGVKAELIFIIDEVGMSEWEDRKERKVIVLRTLERQTIYHRESKRLRHQLIIIYITTGGESLTPYIVTSQNSDVIRKRLMGHGVRLGVDFLLRHLSKPSVSGKLFLKYINTIFVPCLNELRESEEFETCESVLLMHNCSPHMSDGLVALPTSVRMGIITFAPHTTQIFQMLDIVLFGAFKKLATGLKSLDEEEPAGAFLLKVYHDFKQTMGEANISRAFAAIGFICDIEQSPYGLFFDEEKFRQSLGFVQLSDRDTPLDSLSRHRQATMFGWINKPE